ncbi:hypothetical protein [Roseitalea sp. MMSF_3504]|nr:hypothetical protein [Roseitalea sp. MMSF_3504]
MLLTLLVVSGCVAQQSKPFVSKTYSELRIAWGEPVSDITNDRGERVVHYLRDRGIVRYNMPKRGIVASTESCLVSFVMRPQGTDWIITEARWPVKLAC